MGGSGLVAIALLVLAYAAVSRRLLGTVVTPAMVFVAGGIVASADVLGWLDPTIGSDSVRWVAEATLTVVLFSDASRLDFGALRREYVVPLRLLAIGLPLTIVAGALAGVALLGELVFIEAVLLAIVLAPTDAALGQAVVTDARVPSRVRQGLNVESGLNDGLCVPLLLIALAVVSAEAGQETQPVRLVVEEIGFGVVGGVVSGALGATALRLGRRRGWVAEQWAPLAPLAAAGLSYGLATALGGSGLIAAFSAGLAFGAIALEEDERAAGMLETIGDGFSAATFFVFGAAVVPIIIGVVDGAMLVFGVLALTVVRMLPVAVALAGTHARAPTVAFVGWFGPRGLASIVFAVLILQAEPIPNLTPILATIGVTVALSVYAHGLTAAPLTERYLAWARRDPRPASFDAEGSE